MPETKTRKTKEENMAIIKETTLKLLYETSYIDISINKIAENSGINISQLYRYFPNGKPDILIAIGNDIVQKGAPDPDQTKYKDPKILLHDLIKFYIETHRKSKKLLISLQTVFLSYPELVAEDAKNVDSGASDLMVLKTCLQRLGLQDNAKLNETTRNMFHLIDTMIHRHVLEVNITSSDEELTDLIVDLIESYVKSAEV